MFTASFLPISCRNMTSALHAHSKYHLFCPRLVSTPSHLLKSSKYTIFHPLIQTEYPIYSKSLVKIPYLLPMFYNNTTSYAHIQSVNHHYSLRPFPYTMHICICTFMPIRNINTSAHILLAHQLSVTDQVIEKRHSDILLLILSNISISSTFITPFIYLFCH